MRPAEKNFEASILEHSFAADLLTKDVQGDKRTLRPFC
jgi:hypothetical protein